MSFSENLKELRKNAKLSQQDLADKLKVTKVTISKWENSDIIPDEKVLAKLAKVLKCDVSDLTGEVVVNEVKKEEVIDYSLAPEKQKKLKGLCKFLSIISKIGKICLKIAVPFVIIALCVVPFVLKNLNVENDQIIYKSGVGKISLYIENEKLMVTYKDHKEEVKTNKDTEIKYGFAEAKKILSDGAKNDLLLQCEISLAVALTIIILNIYILGNTSELFKSIYMEDTPFTKENSRRIRLIAFLMVSAMIASILGSFIVESINSINYEYSTFVSFDIFGVLVLFALAYIFDYGYKLQSATKGKIFK